MEYAIPVMLFLIVVACTMAVLVFVSRLTAEPDGEKNTPFAVDDETPLGDTNEHSDAIDEPSRAA